MRAPLAIVGIVILLQLAGCAAHRAAYRTISMDEIAASLPDEPVAVAFDVDDTLLFSSPGFHYGLNNADGPGATNKYGNDPLTNDAFWNDMNGGFDDFSLPKRTGRALIELHKSRGDTIYFITARRASENETVSALLNRTFGLDSPPVIFMGGRSKSIPIREHGIVLYYGDADTDIAEALEAGIRAIRILRSPVSIDPRELQPGRYGEAVLEGSAL